MRESQTLENKESITSTFLKTVSAFANYGSGEIIFGIADDGRITGIPGSIVPDCFLKEASLDTALMNDRISGVFPVLKPSVDAIGWSGNVTSVIISPRWRYL